MKDGKNSEEDRKDRIDHRILKDRSQDIEG